MPGFYLDVSLLRVPPNLWLVLKEHLTNPTYLRMLKQNMLKALTFYEKTEEKLLSQPLILQYEDFICLICFERSLSPLEVFSHLFYGTVKQMEEKVQWRDKFGFEPVGKWLSQCGCGS